MSLTYAPASYVLVTNNGEALLDIRMTWIWSIGKYHGYFCKHPWWYRWRIPRDLLHIERRLRSVGRFPPFDGFVWIVTRQAIANYSQYFLHINSQLRKPHILFPQPNTFLKTKRHSPPWDFNHCLRRYGFGNQDFT